MAWMVSLATAPARWPMPVVAAAGVCTGLGLLVLHISRASSYLSDAPETCMNCHVMTTQYVTWQHSSHATAATCNDCHVPHESLVVRYLFKAKDGLRHATIFTLRREPQVIRLSGGAVPVVQRNCQRCHAECLGETSLGARGRDDLRCWDCHREVPHGRTRSLSATPGVFQPRLPSAASASQQPTITGRPVHPQ